MKLRVRCRRCGREVRVRLGVTQVWHSCRPPRDVLGIGELPWRGDSPDEIRAAAWALFGGGAP